jgi:hypothetical protein
MLPSGKEFGKALMDMFFFLEAEHLMDVVSFCQFYGSVSISYISIYSELLGI